MTYIIAEPCIDIKDKSCIDVCPVDCIHEADRILVIDPEECIDCFASHEQLVTAKGLRSFVELENQGCRVLTDSGFRPAVVKRFRRKPLVDVELAPAFEERDRYGGTRLTTRNISRFRRKVQATPTHPWLLASGEQTDELTSGQFLPSMRALPRRDSEQYRLGVVHGLVFGDGVEQAGDSLRAAPPLRAALRRARREIQGLLRSSQLLAQPGHPSRIRGTGVVRAPVNLKRSLPKPRMPSTSRLRRRLACRRR